MDYTSENEQELLTLRVFANAALQHCDELKAKHDAATERAIERIRFICVKAGVAPEVMGAICFAVRKQLAD